jgi:glutamate 5-kinase
MDLNNYNKIILKVGTNTLLTENGINRSFLTLLASETAKLIQSGKKIVIVTSGAIGLGKRQINFNKNEPITQFDIKTQQGLAAIGQISLMDEYKKRFDNLGINCAQILLSQRDFEDKTCVNNIKNTFDFLFKQGIIAIVNENDVVATEELRKNGAFSDNDSLASLIANELNAELLIMVTKSGGLIGKDNQILENFTNKNQLLCMEKKSTDGRGGIDSKINAVLKTTSIGCDVFILGTKNFQELLNGNSKGTFCKKNK